MWKRRKRKRRRSRRRKYERDRVGGGQGRRGTVQGRNSLEEEERVDTQQAPGHETKEVEYKGGIEAMFLMLQGQWKYQERPHEGSKPGKKQLSRGGKKTSISYKWTQRLMTASVFIK